MNPGKVVYIYPDVAFAVSFIMNSLILWGTAKINRISLAWFRIIAGALVGALYAAAAAFPQLFLLNSFWVKIPFSIFMVIITFGTLSLRRLAGITLIFYIISLGLGGLFIGIISAISSSPFYSYITDFSQLIASHFFPALILSCIFYVLFTKFSGRLLPKSLSQRVFHVPVTVLFGDSKVELEALIDTGNSLQDPLSGTPVIVAEYLAIKDLFPISIQKAFEVGPDPELDLILESVAQTSWSTRFRVIPFTSLGREHGLLVGFKPDRLEISSGGVNISTKDVIVGVYGQELSPEGTYRALLHPEVLHLMTA